MQHGNDSWINGHHLGEVNADNMPFAGYRRNAGEVGAFNATHARRMSEEGLNRSMPNARRLFGDVPYDKQTVGVLSGGPSEFGWEDYNKSYLLSDEVKELLKILQDG